MLCSASAMTKCVQGGWPKIDCASKKGMKTTAVPMGLSPVVCGRAPRMVRSRACVKRAPFKPNAVFMSMSVRRRGRVVPREPPSE